MFTIHISDDIRAACPSFVGAAVETRFVNTTFHDVLWNEINAFRQDCLKCFTADSIKDISAIKATRAVYKTLGKDPSRYRPSGEALLRRILKGNDLYQINTAVDVVNLASLAFGYSIGGFDADQIAGDVLTLGVGQAGEPYEGIGRGVLNIEGLPVYRDQRGGIGTPTSDHERTKLTEGSTHLLALINGYDGNIEQVKACAEYLSDLMLRFADAEPPTIHFYHA